MSIEGPRAFAFVPQALLHTAEAAAALRAAWRGLARRAPTPAEYRRSSTHYRRKHGSKYTGIRGGGALLCSTMSLYVCTYVGKYIVDSTLLHATDEMMLICSSFEWVRITICYWVKQKEMVVGNS